MIITIIDNTKIFFLLKLSIAGPENILKISAVAANNPDKNPTNVAAAPK